MTAQSLSMPPTKSAERLLVPIGLLAVIEQQALACYPNECCGVLVGRPGARTAAHSVHPVENQRADQASHRYEIDPRQVVRLDRQAEERGQEIIGFYHSHPGQRATPSDSDREYAWPGYLYLIVGLTAKGETEIRAWTYDEEAAAFGERAIALTGLTPSFLGSARKTAR